MWGGHGACHVTGGEVDDELAIGRGEFAGVGIRGWLNFEAEVWRELDGTGAPLEDAEAGAPVFGGKLDLGGGREWLGRAQGQEAVEGVQRSEEAKDQHGGLDTGGGGIVPFGRGRL